MADVLQIQPSGSSPQQQMSQDDCESLHSRFSRLTGVTYCNATWDHILCWPPTEGGATAAQQCPKFKGVDHSKIAYKVCLPSGAWRGKTDNDTTSPAGWTNYSSCYTREMQQMINKLYSGSQHDAERKIQIATNTRILELTGLSLSLASLCISLFIFFRFRSLKNNRTKIHRNLFVAMIIQVLVRLVLYVDQVISRGGIGRDAVAAKSQGIDNTKFVCEAFYVLLEYARTAMFIWMFIEGLYLNTMISVTVFSPKFYTKFYYATGWGVPIIMTAVWAVITGLHYGDINCWWNYNLTTFYWILEGPRIAVIGLNVLFLANIIYVLVTKMRQSNSSEALQARKAVKAAIVLLPLLGINNIINMVDAPLDRSVAEFAVWSYVTHFLASFQGFFVSLLYCFLNGEVRLAISKMIYDYCSTRTSETYRRGSGFSSVFLTTVAEPTRGEPARALVACGCVRVKNASSACQGTCRLLLPPEKQTHDTTKI